MAVLADVQAQLARKATQITTTEGRISILDAAIAGGTATPEEILEYQDLTTNVLPDLLSAQTLLNTVESKLGISVGTFGSVEGILNSPDIFSSKMSSQIQNFNLPECTGGIIEAGNEMLQKMSNGIDSLIALGGQVIDDTFGDSIEAIQSYISGLDMFSSEMSAISGALETLNTELTKLAGVISAAMASNPCVVAVADKMMSLQSPANQELYTGLKTVVNDPSQKAELIKSAYNSIKLS